jgi:hypothetical protein
MNLIIAPTASGKSHFIHEQIIAFPNLRDADLDPNVRCVYRTLKYKFGNMWWLDGRHAKPKYELLTHAKKLMSPKPDLIWFTAEWALDDPHNDISVVVIIPLPAHLRNLAARREQEVAHGGPEDVDTILASRRQTLERATMRGLFVVDNFLAAVREVNKQFSNQKGGGKYA